MVHVNGNSLKSCTALAADIDGSKVTTIEGLATNGKCILCKKHLKNYMVYNVDFVLPAWL